jgi:phosphoesterase RecJ-like protein
MSEAITAAIEAIRGAGKIVLATHINPDGDTLGSALALTHALRSMGKEAVPLSHDGVPDIYRWMPGADLVQTDTPDRDFDLAIVCDTGTAERIGRSKDAVFSAPVSVCIDHHAAEGEFGQIRVVDSTSPSTGELVYGLLGAMGAEVTPDMAQCLMCAVVTDTGSFRYKNTRPETFRVAADLMERGACPSAIAELVFDSRSYASLKLMGRALDSLRVSEDGRVAWAHVRAEDFLELGAGDEETEGIVGHVRAVKSAVIGLLFREIPGRKVRISLRGRDGADVNRIAQVFGGGGHKLAAGCALEMPLAQAEETVVSEALRQLDEAP